MSMHIGRSDALVVIDAQHDFVDKTGALSVAGVEGESKSADVIARILFLHSLPFGHRATTEDEHPSNHIEFKIFPPHCVKGTLGQQYVPTLQSIYDESDEHIIKGDNPDIIAYSIATSRDFSGHISRLRKKGITRVFLTGWAFTHCVGESAIAYATQGFEAFVVRDATRSVPPPYGDPEVMNQKLKLYWVTQIVYSEIA